MSAHTCMAWRVGIAPLLALSLLASGCASMQSAPAGPERPPLAAYGVMQRDVAGELEFETCRFVDCPQPTPKTRPQPIRQVSSGVLGQAVPISPEAVNQAVLEGALPSAQRHKGEQTP